MNRIILACLAAGLIALSGGTASASSFTFTIDFTGNVVQAFDLINGPIVTTPPIGDAVTGHVTLTGNTTISSGPIVPFNGNRGTATFDQASWSFTEGANPAETGSASVGSLEVDSYGVNAFPIPSNEAQTFISAGTFPSGITLSMFWDGTTQPLSLSNFPTSDGAAQAYFLVPLTGAGTFISAGGIAYQFGIESFNASFTPTTPIPASGWLFLSALGGLGWLARRAMGQRSARMPATA